MDEIFHVWKIDGLQPYVPMYDARFRKAGKVLLERRRSMPGYVFIESPARGKEFYLSVNQLIRRSERSLKLLRNGVGYLDQYFEMNASEHDILKKLFNNERCIEMSQGFIEETAIEVTDGPLVGLEGLIKKVDRHKMEAIIEVEFMGAVREMTVGLEIVKRLS